MNEATCVIDGFGPLPVIRPGSVADLAAAIRQAAASGAALYPLGGQTHLGLGMPPTRRGHAVDVRGLADVIDFPARDMTITVQAGVTINRLRETITPENLQLPIDVPHAERATLGGIIAANVSGPRRFGYGTLRDYVIGISALNDEGNEFKAGGRVVKNVAGYDLCKLLVGSLGTLGIITQVTLKLRPIAEERAILGLACDANKLDCILTCLHSTRTRPVCLDVLNCAAAQSVFAQAHLKVPESAWLVLVGYEGNMAAVHWQVQQLVKEVATQCRIEARVDFTAEPLCHAVVEYGGAREGTTVKANLLPSATAAFCLAADMDGAAVHAHAGSGIVFGHWNADLTKERAASILNAWRERAGKARGSVIIQSCPSNWKAALDVWGPTRNDGWLMREVKRIFDPRGVFNPGRFVEGI